MFEDRIREVWSFYLPSVQRILNYSVDGSIGTQPARVIFGDVETSDIAFDVPRVSGMGWPKGGSLS